MKVGVNTINFDAEQTTTAEKHNENGYDDGDEDEWDDFVSNEQEDALLKQQTKYENFDLQMYDIFFERELAKNDCNIDDYLAEPFEYNTAYVNSAIEDLWFQLCEVDDCDLLRFQYKNSFIENILYDALGIDRTPHGRTVSTYVRLK